MVHALNEIRRVLVPDGILIDLRPLAEAWPIEVASSRRSTEAGRVNHLSAQIEDDSAANVSLERAVREGLYVRERQDLFPFLYYWDSPNEMKEFMDEEWSDFATVDEKVWQNLRGLWAAGDADARPRVRVKMLITRYRNGA